MLTNGLSMLVLVLVVRPGIFVEKRGANLQARHRDFSEASTIFVRKSPGNESSTRLFGI